MYDYLFETNTQNAYTLTEKHNLSEYNRDYILHNFWPIIKVINYDTDTIKEKLNTLKKEFTKENTAFDLEIFNRENTDLLIYELNQYIDVLKRGKVEIWEEYNDEFFYIFKMKSDIKENTLLISNKNITQLEMYFKNALSIITKHTKSEPPQKTEDRITDSQYKNYVKSVKDYIINESKNSIECFQFEEINPLKYLSKDKQLKKLNELINKFYEILNVGYPFVAYNFLNNVFDEENFFSNIPLSIMANEGVISIDNLEFNKEIKEFRIDYARAKFLELLLRERELVLNPVTEPINFSNPKKDELPIMENIEIIEGVTQEDVRRAIRIDIKLKYQISLKEFLRTNYLADEVFYINHIDKYQKERLQELENKVSFFDISEGDKVTDDIKDQWYEDKTTRDHYWYYKEYQSFLQERLLELEKITTIKKSKTITFNLVDELEAFEIFNNNFNDEIINLFNKDISKNETLNIYYKDYLPKYLSKINELISHTEQMQDDFKLNFPELKTDFQNLNTITSKFKKSIFNALETTLESVIKSDYERYLSEYLNITNKLETDLKIEGKNISDFFDLFYKRMLHIKSNPKPQQPELSNSTKTEHITIGAKEYISLIINSYFDAQESLGNDPELIDLVKDLFQQTILRVGKKQEKENFMTPYEYNSRIYFALESMKQCGYNDDWETFNNTEFMRIETIIKDIKRPISRIEFKNIVDWIDELTTENQQPEPEQLDLSSNTKQGTNETPTIEKDKPKKLKKVLFQFIHNITDKDGFIRELKETFPTEIGKSIKAIIDILTDDKILIYGTKEFKTLYEQINLSFNRDIGTYNSVQNVKTVDKETRETIYKKLNPLIIKYKIS